MELRVQKPTFPEVIEFNFDELKHEITERASAYANLVYTEDQIQDAKKDRATLNKFVKALSDERIKIKKECLKPYEDFEKKIKELDGIVNKAILNIDKQVKGYEDQKKAEKLEKIREYFQKVCFPDWVKFEMILDQKWLNASVSLNTAHGAIDSMLECIEKDLSTLSSLTEFAFEAKEVYKCTLDIRKALETANGLSEMQRKKEEAELKKAEPVKTEKPFSECMNPPEEDAVWINFAAKLTTIQAGELRDFFLAREIEFKAI